MLSTSRIGFTTKEIKNPVQEDARSQTEPSPHQFGSLAYVDVPVTPGGRKHHENAKIGGIPRMWSVAKCTFHKNTRPSLYLTNV
ncbi:LOW QUALITY PROTEIN: DNA-directed RNA polymerase III complex subunit Rpc2 [Phytophthora palmivora]|uniref:DNA-directed RNA polymerase III complex subunit Rpc2 n=1 Tax=Phytophthora palmivora TaxID=4796 RepID=A0A2P4X281_9STRA|nr:LOW QUALITY PROTEIN: DNA-directed RNA polymerase III complex subunit Rpc2 [Phytophthora palmivora]